MAAGHRPPRAGVNQQCFEINEACAKAGQAACNGAGQLEGVCAGTAIDQTSEAGAGQKCQEIVTGAELHRASRADDHAAIGQRV
ncbi:MAG: hypothetical protein QOG25_1633, partial [Acetobacteraceae bacterium]|nr:hypothetical protein [Acetobacteraceae bacterium]